MSGRERLRVLSDLTGKTITIPADLGTYAPPERLRDWADTLRQEDWGLVPDILQLLANKIERLLADEIERQHPPRMDDPDVCEFILARIEEEEALAKDAIGRAVFQTQTGRWAPESVPDQYGSTLIVFAVADGGGKTQVADLTAAWEGQQRADYIAHFDPASTLARCAAYRLILGRADRIDAAWWEEAYLYALASIWAEHPDFYQGWSLEQ